MRHLPVTTRPATTRARRSSAALAALTVGLLAAACSSSPSAGSTTDSTQRPAAPASPTVTADASQPAASPVKVDRVDMPRLSTGGSGGVVALCADADGSPGTCDAYAAVPSGLSYDVVIHPSHPLAPGPYLIGLYNSHGLPDAGVQPLAVQKVQLT